MESGQFRIESTDYQPNLTIVALDITPEFIRLKIASQDGREELLRARGGEALSIANMLDQVYIQFHIYCR